MSNSKDAVRKILDAVKADKRTSLTAPEGKLVCDAYGIPVPKEGVAKSAAEAAKIADRHGLPGGDEDRLAGHPAQDRGRRRDGRRQDRRRRREELRRPFWPTPGNTRPTPRSRASRSSRCWPAAPEVIVGSITDGSFGKLVAFGLGGVLVEVLKDVTFRLAPATKEDALSMLDGIQAHEMLKGVRGGDPVNRDALADIIVKVSQLVSDFPEIVETRSQPGVRHQGRTRSPPTCASSSTSTTSRARRRVRAEEIVTAMNRIMQPKAVAVIGASAEDGKIGNSVMKNLINGGYKGEIYPIHPEGRPRSWATRPTRASRTCRA